MINQAQLQVIRSNHYQLSPIGLGRRRSVPNGPLSGLPQVIKLPRHRHQSLNCQNNHQSEKINVNHVSITRKVLPPSISTYITDQKLANANESLQSVSILILDSNRKPPSITNRSVVPSVCFVKRNDSRRSSLLQTKGNNPIKPINVQEEHNYRRSSMMKIYASNNHQNMMSDKKETTNNYHKYKNKKQGFFKHCCACSPLCKFLSIIAFIVLAAIIAAITIALLSLKTTTTTITTKTTASTSTTTSVTTITTTTTVTTVTSTTSTTETTITTTMLCSPSCTSDQTCIGGVCLNVGYLACALTWSRPGDGDIVVTTPNNRTIYYNNKGPTNTDGGILDRDDLVGTGPENVYWPIGGSLPPTGTYYICFEPYSITPAISITNPITVVYQIIRPPSSIIVFTRTFTSVIKNSYNCESTSPTLVGSFTYP